MENILERNIGTGVLFPFKLKENSSGKTGIYPVSGTPDLILHNLNSLIQYELGFRIRQEDFGTRLMECIEEPNTQAQAFLVEQFLKQALRKFENRIVYKKAEIVQEGTKLIINIIYSIKNTNLNDSVNISYDL